MIGAASDQSVVDAVNGAATGVKDTAIAVGAQVLPYAGSLLALVVGWRFARRFVKG